MSVLIVSDLHLDSDRDPKLDLFERSIRGATCRARQVLLLGDLFEAWVGDDDDSPLARRVAGALRRLADAGIEVAFIHGNRDFLVGAAYAARCGMRLLPEVAVVTVGAARVVVLHGDSLCTDDLSYQGVRRQFRDPAWQHAFLQRPLAERLTYAEQARAASRAHAAATGESIGDIVNDEALALLRTHDAPWMVHGHTHRPAIHHHDINDRAVRRIVTADWLDDRGELLWLDTGANGMVIIEREPVVAG